MSVTWAGSVLVAAHTAVLGEIDGEGATAYVDIYDSGDVLLSTLPLDFPSGTVNGTTGQLTMAFGARDEEAAASGTASYATLCDAADAVLATITCAEGSTPVSNTCVLTSLAIVAGSPVEGVSFTIG